MTPTYTRNPRQYWERPFSQQPLRVRDTRKPRPEPEPVSPLENPLNQLVIGNPYSVGLLPGDSVSLIAEGGQDYAESMDATYECEHGRLAGDRTPPCGCWPQEPAPATPKFAKPEPVYPEPARVPDLIPEWVLADARDLYASGMTVRRIATAVLPVTDCTDIPTCEQLLKLRLEPEERRTQ